MAVKSPFMWGSKGQKLTPEQVERERDRADALLEVVGDTSPVAHWLQGAGRVVNAITGKVQDRRASASEALGMESADAYIQNNPILASLIGSGGSGVTMGIPGGAQGVPMDATGGAVQGSSAGGDKLEGVDPRIDEILSEAARRTGINIGVSEGLRSEERQREMVAQGKSQTMNSKHRHGGAADYHIIGPDGKANWDFEAYRPLADEAKKVAAELGYEGFEWGGDWKTLKDGVHFQFAGGGSPQVASPVSGGGAQGGQPISTQPGVIQALAGAMSDPWVAKKYGPVIESLMGQQMRRGDMQYQQQLAQQDPMYQAKLAKLTTPDAIDPWANTKVINGQVVRMGANGPESIADFSTPQDPSAPTTKNVTMPDGSDVMVQWNPETQVWDAAPIPEGGTTGAGGGTDLTADQSKLTLFQTLQKETQPVLLSLERQFDPANLSDPSLAKIPIAGNYFTSPEYQMYQTAAAAWAEGALRIATGAAATQPEIERNIKTYFAQPGDTPQTVAFKAQMREMYDRAINNALGKAPASGSLPIPKPGDFAAQVGKSIPDAGGVAVPEGIDPKTWEFMTPEEKALFQ